MVSFLLFFLQTLVFFKKLAVVFFAKLLIAPIRQILRFIFYRVVVKFYSSYLSALKYLGITRLRDRFKRSRSVFANPMMIHVFLAGLTLAILVFNLTDKAEAQSMNNVVRGTLIAELVSNEYDSPESEELIEETFDQGVALSRLPKRYTDESANLKNGIGQASEGSGELSDDGQMAMIEDGSAMVKPGIVSTSKTKQTRTAIVQHTVQAGETVSTIAQEYEVSVNTILWENSLTAYSIIKPGDQLAILPFTGIQHKVEKGDNLKRIADEYGVDGQEIIAANGISDSSKLAIGQKLMIPGGKKLKVAAASTASSAGVKAVSGYSALKSLVAPGGAKPVAGNLMNWPTVGHRITQYYSWRHLAIDVANKTGTALYAADAGTIEFAGWSNGYGNNIIVNHGGGKKTRYAHLSKFYVKKGESVSKGESIGAMGNTGWSTGPHLHFEVIINGVKQNPLNYVK